MAGGWGELLGTAATTAGLSAVGLSKTAIEQMKHAQAQAQAQHMHAQIQRDQMRSTITTEEYELAKEKNTMLKASCDNQAERIKTLTTALKYYTCIKGEGGDYARKILDEDENG